MLLQSSQVSTYPTQITQRTYVVLILLCSLPFAACVWRVAEALVRQLIRLELLPVPGRASR